MLSTVYIHAYVRLTTISPMFTKHDDYSFNSLFTELIK